MCALFAHTAIVKKLFRCANVGLGKCLFVLIVLLVLAVAQVCASTIVKCKDNPPKFPDTIAFGWRSDFESNRVHKLYTMPSNELTMAVDGKNDKYSLITRHLTLVLVTANQSQQQTFSYVHNSLSETSEVRNPTFA